MNFGGWAGAAAAEAGVRAGAPAGVRPISAKLILLQGTVEGLLKKNEHPPAMHSVMGWCKHGYINQMVELVSQRFQGIAGRSNDQHRMLNGKKDTEGR